MKSKMKYKKNGTDKDLSKWMKTIEEMNKILKKKRNMFFNYKIISKEILIPVLLANNKMR